MQERRRNARYEIADLLATVCGERFEVLNLSLGGMLLLGDHERETGATMELSFDEVEASTRISGRIVYVGPDSGPRRRFRIGVAFGRLSRPSRDGLQRLIDHHVA